ncbi:MAG: radical SAM protein [Methanoregula sp.]|nr:MAG: radical SAM protein [Methanoregula sp.]
MKIVLISTPSRTYAPNYIPPLGIMYLASHLRNLGHTIKIIDIAKTRQSNESTIKELKIFNPDLIGVSAIITAYRFVKKLVKGLKQSFPSVPVVIGGHIALDNVNLLLNHVGVDYVITGYGELKIAGLVDHLSGEFPVGKIPALSYKRNGEIISNPGDLFFKKIDEIPLPAYDLVDMKYYVTVTKKFPKLDAFLKKTKKTSPPMRALVVIGARGCTDHCSFCVHEFEHKGFHVHSIDYIMKNIEVLYNTYGVRIFQMGEDLFLFNTKQAKEFVEAMNSNFPDAYFQCSTRADYITPELIQILENSNCFTLGYGFESGNDYILNILGKRMTRDINIRAYSLIGASDITPACSFMVGSPGETRETIADTINAIRDARITDSAVFITTPYPGSRLFRWCIENGLIRNEDAYLDFISDRDAVKLSINFTPYPDVIVKMMKIVVENALEDNKRQIDSNYHIPIIRAIVHHRLVPFLYNGYFDLRRFLGKIIPMYRKATIDYELNKKGTVKISSDG